MHWCEKSLYELSNPPQVMTPPFFNLRSGKQPSLGLNISTAPREFVRQAIMLSCEFSNVSRLRKNRHIHTIWLIHQIKFFCACLIESNPFFQNI